MLRNAYQINFQTSKGNTRNCLVDTQPLYRSGQPLSEDSIIGYAVMVLDDKGGNKQQLGFYSTKYQAVDSFMESLQIYFRDEGIRFINSFPVQVIWPTGEVVKQVV